MSTPSSTLLRYAKQITEGGSHALLYWGASSPLAARRVTEDNEWPGVIICECSDDTSFMIVSDALVCVKEVEQFTG